ncbi:E3 ubiquitin-protein ligase Siah1 [Cryptotermes secundus]|uniref:E3 ubiquitin-protein ligase n=2 Tax=Cryptotermes secundus TaxID=105785 RepID=A0A2J7PVD3_9NEOP|nr:E3 ubiquitin-protein ligase Siah1 isoform X2 [Cryptotermes secundus]XP_023720521.1 E3 ubiquitin-protein ligase Siah1 isoform X2 [Cryptotermes secundus]XP_023720522.1 E3 ubiquitin-protein ligase Siah1 isoform X2 [Cryptotermes secundus]PNF20296.1 E3 ubiquitin-protein ligase Siah1 [Cryptotermes secundus]PNF20297.1 E3 ubiquitin-protein ligase Siah1 [Cryptotermes secundus]
MLPSDRRNLEKISLKLLSASRTSLSDEQDEDLNTAVLKLLQCSASSCLRYLYPPIKQCRSGHCLCLSCSELPRPICPQCSTPLIQARNVALEAIATKLLAACKYRSEGCPEAMPHGYSMLAHEMQCHFRLHSCFAGKCKWTGTVRNILEHMESHHRERVFLGSEKVFKIKKINNREDMDMMFLFSCEEGDFWVKFIYSKAETSFFGAVQYIGKADIAGKHRYRFEIKTSGDESESLYTFSRRTHADTTNFETIFNNHDCFWAPINIAKYFAENDVLSVKLNIDYIGN